MPFPSIEAQIGTEVRPSSGGGPCIFDITSPGWYRVSFTIEVATVDLPPSWTVQLNGTTVGPAVGTGGVVNQVVTFFVGSASAASPAKVEVVNNAALAVTLQLNEAQYLVIDEISNQPFTGVVTSGP